jgi:hypothetical protein
VNRDKEISHSDHPSIFFHLPIVLLIEHSFQAGDEDESGEQIERQ